MRLPLVVKDIDCNLSLLKEIIYPRKCAVCNCQIDDGCFCERCRSGYLLLQHKSFSKQELHLWEYDVQLLPEDVLGEQLLIYKYDGAIKEALHRLKFDAKYDYLPTLKEELRLALPPRFSVWLNGFDYACCIPTSAERLQQRGFDIPHELFKSIFGNTSCQYLQQLLIRKKHTMPLFELNKEQRRQELSGCFAVQQGFDIRGKHILLCDDIYTTGSTFAEAGAALLRAGAESVAALAFSGAKENW